MLFRMISKIKVSSDLVWMRPCYFFPRREGVLGFSDSPFATWKEMTRTHPNQVGGKVLLCVLCSFCCVCDPKPKGEQWYEYLFSTLIWYLLKKMTDAATLFGVNQNKIESCKDTKSGVWRFLMREAVEWFVFWSSTVCPLMFDLLLEEGITFVSWTMLREEMKARLSYKVKRVIFTLL